MYVQKPIAFTIASTDHGTLIVNKNDYQTTNSGSYGVGCQLFANSSYDVNELQFICELLKQKRKYCGNGVVAIDCGANIGIFTIEWAKLMTEWGNVIAYEPQERIFYALAGNIAINNVFNATAKFNAVGSESRTISIPKLNYKIKSSFGSLEIKKLPVSEDIGQKLDYENGESINQIHLDSQKFERLDFLKIDVEGMEMDVLIGAKHTIKDHKPLIFIEYIKSNLDDLINIFKELNYKYFYVGTNIFAINRFDPIVKNISEVNGKIRLNQTI